jgi:HPt (histidine-containing phosphotransfer) domain-containing protein
MEGHPLPADVLDAEALARLRELGGDELVTSLARLFLGEGDARLSVFERAIKVGDTAGVTEAAHTLKGSGGYLGATRLAQLCGALESLDQSREPGDSSRLLGDICTEFEQVLLAVERLCSSPTERIEDLDDPAGGPAP